MNRRKKRRRKSKLILFVILVILCVILYFAINFVVSSTKPTRVVSSIKGYDYTLEKRDTTLKKENFELLKSTLESSNIKFEDYAKYLSKLYIIDLYTMSNKKSRYDVGGSEYVYPEYVETYNLKVQDTLYKTLINGNNKHYPTVKTVEVEDISEDQYSYNNVKYDAYKVDLKWTYNKSDGYDEEGTVIVIKDEKMLYVAELITGEVADE